MRCPCSKEFVPQIYGTGKFLCNNCKILFNKYLLKERCLKYLTGKCQKCGYDKCPDALEFHHRDPSKKKFKVTRTY